MLLLTKFEVSCPAFLRMTSHSSEPSPGGAMSLDREMHSGFETVSAEASIPLDLGMNVLCRGQLLS